MKVQMVAFLLFAITFHQVRKFKRLKSYKNPIFFYNQSQVPSMSVPASFDPEYAHGPVDLIPLESDSGSTENDDDDEELGNVVVISFDDENTFEVMKISSDLESEILAQVKKLKRFGIFDY